MPLSTQSQNYQAIFKIVLIHLKTCVFYKSNAGLTLLKTVEIAWKWVKMTKSEKTPKSVKIVRFLQKQKLKFYILSVYLDVIKFSIHTAFREDLKEGKLSVTPAWFYFAPLGSTTHSIRHS